jgi:hypothetical protein
LPNFDQPLRDAASDLESGASFYAGPDFPGKFSHGRGWSRLDGKRPDRPDVLRDDRRLRTAGEQNGNDNCGKSEWETDHGALIPITN